MKKFIVLLSTICSASATGNLIIKNHDVANAPIIAVIEGLPDNEQCFLAAPHGTHEVDYAQSNTFPLSFDSYYKRINGWVRLYRQTDFDKDSSIALRKCNRERIYLKHTPLYEKYVEINNSYYDPDVTINWPEDAISRKDIS